MKNNLLPCPFCPIESANEASPIMVSAKKKHFDKPHFTIQCSNCGCEPDFCVETEKEAIFYWNSRRMLNPSQEKVAHINDIKKNIIDEILKLK